MGMVLERAGGWKSLTEYVQTNGYSLDTLNSLYWGKLKPSFDTIFPPTHGRQLHGAVEGAPVVEAVVVETVAAESAPAVFNLMEKKIVVPFTGGKSVSGKMLVIAGASVMGGYAAYKVAVA
eukprot:7366083-Pyramimonas_sp.AAC.1